MKRAKLKIEILTVIFCSLIFAFSEKNNSIYADEVLTDMELPTGRLVFEEETEEAADEDYESIEESDIAEQSLLRTADIAADDWNKYGSDYFYDQLSDEEKAYWNALDVICEKYLTTETDAVTTKSGAYRMQAISGSTLAKAQQKNVLLMFRYSNPQYYFLNATVYTISYSNDTISLVFGIYPAFENGTDRMEKTEKVKEQVDAWQEQIDQCSKDYEKVKKIHDLICEKVYYNQALVNSDFATESTEYSQSVYSVFCTDKTVCAGYAQSFAMMCNGSGIDAVAVTSYYHEWNKVRLNDSWYNVDCTWDDADGTIYYGYFERSDNYYDTVNYSSYVFHAEEDIWEGYLPACTIDSGATSTAPGTIATITQTAAKPVISASVSGTSYKVKITSKTSGAVIYYTTDGSEPNAAYSKGTRYTGAFTVSPGKTVKAVAVCNKYADSSVSSKKLAKLTTYKITFKSNGGKGSMSKQSMAKGVSTAISKNKFSRKYYTFTGWNTKANGKGKSYKNKAKIKLTKNITLYAQWKLTKYKITYKLNGGKNAKKNPTAYTYKTSTIKLKNPTRKGYVFKGWYLDKKFKKKVTVINKGSRGNKTLYAKWKKK